MVNESDDTAHVVERCRVVIFPSLILFTISFLKGPSHLPLPVDQAGFIRIVDPCQMTRLPLCSDLPGGALLLYVWNERKKNEELGELLGLEPVSLMIKKSRLRWFGHVERKDDFKDDLMTGSNVV